MYYNLILLLGTFLTYNIEFVYSNVVGYKNNVKVNFTNGNTLYIGSSRKKLANLLINITQYESLLLQIKPNISINKEIIYRNSTLDMAFDNNIEMNITKSYNLINDTYKIIIENSTIIFDNNE